MRVNEEVVRLSTTDLSVLGVCEELEEKFAGMYRYFEGLFADDPALSLIWAKTADEEENHARQFGLAVRLKGTGMETVTADLSRVRAIQGELEKMVAAVLASKPSAREALRVAVQLEDKLEDFHMNSLVVFDDPDLKRCSKP